MENYITNITGRQWTQTRRLTTEFINTFNRIKSDQGYSVWKELARANGPFSDVKERMAVHNFNVRSSWTRPVFNEREKVVEVYQNYISNVVTVKHVDSETAVREKTFTSRIPQGLNHPIEDDQHIFGNSELDLGFYDRFDIYHNMSFAEYCHAVDNIAIMFSQT